MDDELNQLLVNPLRPGVRLHAIIDACHSGSVLDMEYRAEFHNGMPVWTNEFSKRPSIYKVHSWLVLPLPLSLIPASQRLAFGPCYQEGIERGCIFIAGEGLMQMR